MRKFLLPTAILSLCLLVSWTFYQAFRTHPGSGGSLTIGAGEEAREDGIRLAQEQEFNQTRDVKLGYIPKDRLVKAYNDLMTQKARIDQGLLAPLVAGFTWTERGSNKDTIGPSNGNTRGPGNAAVTSGRMRAICIDLSDATHKSIWVGGIDGGLWHTGNVYANPATWTLVNDFFGNLAVSSICQDPSNHKILYFGTGEKTFNADAVRGGGVWKSTDGGVTWSLLPSTTTFWNVSKVLCDGSGNVYVATLGNGQGLQRSTNGGTSWTNITPSTPGGGTRITDMVISSTGRLHVTKGYLGQATNQSGYFYTTTPATVDSTHWTSPTTSFTPVQYNCALACKGDTLYVLNANSSYQTPQVYKSVNGGAVWTATLTSPPAASGTNDLSSGQGWYCLAIGVDPTNAANVLVGGLNCYRTSNGGNTWSQATAWVGTTTVYLHADQHIIVWDSTSSQILVGSDGGLFYSAYGGSFADRNVGLRLKQFYSCAIHPTTTNYFLAGAQDNGCHQFASAGLGKSVEVTGGDGAFVHIDQGQPQYQFGSYVYNQYRRSTDGGNTWSFINYSSSAGQFINPTDYDNTNKKFYAGGAAGQYVRWEDPQTGSTFTPVTISAFGTGSVTHVKISPYTSNRVYFGTSAGKIVKVDNANMASPTATDITGSGMSGSTVSCVAVGNNDNNLLATFSNYGAAHVWVTTTGGGSAGWTNISGNLPDIPVRWALYYPDSNTQAIIATEMGIYETGKINGASTVWNRDPNFPVVRTDMLKYRKSDRTLAAATHGRGLWTTIVPTTSPFTAATPAGSAVTTKSNMLPSETGSMAQKTWIEGNPFHSSIQIRLARIPLQKVSLDLVSLSGTVICRKEYSPATALELDLAGMSLSPGVYVLRIRSEGQVFVHKVVKQ